MQQYINIVVCAPSKTNKLPVFVAAHFILGCSFMFSKPINYCQLTTHVHASQ